MVTVARPRFVPDPALTQEQMEACQREIANVAEFEDDPVVTSVLRELTDTATPAWDHGDAVIAGVDQAFIGDRAISAIVTMQAGDILNRVHAITDVTIPYIPGFLSFREGGPILKAFKELQTDPDIALFDGNGRLHFRQAGLATHIGVVLDLPTIGVAKRLLCGEPTTAIEPGEQGSRTAILAGDRVEAPPDTLLGYAVQTRQYPNARRINPVYVSPGHRVAPATAVTIAERLCAGYKLPEPIRLADSYADDIKATVE